MARYRILAWDGIPAQLKVLEDDRRPLSVPLPDWYTQEIDRVAMRKGLVGSDAYLELWQWSAEKERSGSAEEVAAAVVAELEIQWRAVQEREDAPTTDAEPGAD